MQIEEGKWYRRRDGLVDGPVRPNNDRAIYRWIVPTGGAYTDKGEWQIGVVGYRDLVEEVPAPVPASALVEGELCGSPTTAQKTSAAEGVPVAPDFAEVGYEPLAAVLQEALRQASAGKGKERHARGDTPFDRQPIMEIGRQMGVGGPLFQVAKKAQEARGMIQRGEPERAVAELLGAINYLAAAVLLIREGRP